MKYVCPKNPDHIGVTTEATKKSSPHNARVVCLECGEFIKWASQQDIIRINTEFDLGIDLRTSLENFEKHAKKAIDALRKAGLI